MQWAVCYILVFQHFIICISYLGSVLDWKPCVLLTDWLEWRGSRDHNPPYLTTLYLVFILILILIIILIIIFILAITLMLILLILAMMEGSSWADSSGKSGSQEASGDAPTSQHSITARALCICSTLHFVFVVLCILYLRYFLFCIEYLWYFLYCVLFWGTFYFYFVFVLLSTLYLYSVFSTKLDDNVQYIWKTKTASLHGWSRIQRSLLKRMHWNSEQRIFWGKNYLIFELHWNSEPCKVQRRKKAVKILHQQCREFHCRNVDVNQVLKFFWFDIHQLQQIFKFKVGVKLSLNQCNRMGYQCLYLYLLLGPERFPCRSDQ